MALRRLRMVFGLPFTHWLPPFVSLPEEGNMRERQMLELRFALGSAALSECELGQASALLGTQFPDMESAWVG